MVFFWDVQCHGLCGVGNRLRKVRCPVEGKCAHREKPRTRKPCFKVSCYDWTTEKWGSVSKNVLLVIIVRSRPNLSTGAPTVASVIILSALSLY